MSKLKKYTMFRPLILSRHPSHSILRLKNKQITLLPYRSVVRFGSSTEVHDTIANGGNRVEINTVQSIKNSASKLLMKQKFTEAGVKTAKWMCAEEHYINEEGLVSGIEEHGEDSFSYPIVAKAHYGSKGRGNTLIKTQKELSDWMIGKTLSNYIFEKFMNYAYEFRLHVTAEGCFYACRKALKQGVAEKDKWRRHDDICVWFLEESPEFYKPNSWLDIETDCIKALKAIGADLLSFDIKVQSPVNKNGKQREYQNYILLECNSASSMDNGSGEVSVCAKKYIDIIPKIILNKIKNNE